MRVLVFGQSGQIATAISDQARGSDLELEFVGRPEIELADGRGVAEAVNRVAPDVVVNAAAYTAVDRAETEPDLVQRVNGAGAGLIAAAAHQAGAAVIHISTDYVFNGEKAEPYTESDPPSPTNAYGLSKLAGEQAVAAANPRHVILRTAWVFAPYGSNFVRTMLRLAGDHTEVSVVGDQIGNPTYAADIAAAILAIAGRIQSAEALSPQFGVFNLAGRGEASWAELARAVFEGSEMRGGPGCAVKAVTTAEYPTRVRRPANSRLDCRKIQAVHGVTMPHWHDSLQACLDALIGRPGQGAA
jgi:dTDP-4-dehydrorhamnose reductase